MSTSRAALLPAYSRPSAYWALTKPDVSFLVVLTTAAGYYLGSSRPLDVLRLANTVLATALIAAGTAALNQYFERAADARMRRTASRPLPSGQLKPFSALVFGVSLCVSGSAYLTLAVGWLPSILGVLTSLSYLGFYTPLKSRTTLATLVGAFPGAVPPLIGWAAARGSLTLEAWILYAILFLWQFPHFMSIAWMYREDYARAGIQMLPVVDRSGLRTFWQVLVTAVVLVPVSLLPAVVGLAGIPYFFGALVLGMLQVQVCLWAARTKSNVRAKWLMHATVLYIPLLLALLMWDKQ